MKRILIVEDNEKSLYLERFIMEKGGHEVIEARDGLGAFNKVSQQTPDLILLDMQPHRLGGYEAIRRVKSDERSSKIPVIALTAYTMKGDREKALEVECSGYIEKPIETSTFLEEVNRHVV